MIRPTSTNLRGTQPPAPSIPASASPPVPPGVAESARSGQPQRGTLPRGWHYATSAQNPRNHATRR